MTRGSLPSRIVIPVANPLTAQELVRIGASLMDKRGSLTVLVDSAAHRFQLQMLLNGGLRAEIQRRFSGAITAIRLVPGRFFAIDLAGQARYEF